MDHLALAQLIIYAILALPILFITFRHGKAGLLGWFYCFAFCTLRLVGSGMQVSASKKGTTNTTAAIISSIGLSPLLLATGGILHEARAYRQSRPNVKIEWILTLFIHISITAGLALVAAGVSSANSQADASTHKTLAKVGIIVLLLSWGLICAFTLGSFLSSQWDSQALGYRDGTLLLYGVVCSLPFTCIRLIYATVSLFVGSATLNQVTGSLAIRVCLGMLPELASILVFVIVGLLTRHNHQTSYQTANLSSPLPESENDRTKSGGTGVSAINLNNLPRSAYRD
ncbi:hypothetical protein F5884DRAFT_273453 [Xylogone sp. PMI_703]|nr:hypothetical protein F5884DRAFT_273453 [Xylogone sp. PMI_703]